MMSGSFSWALISRLLPWRGPAAILGRIGSAVVNAINGVAVWAWSHVRKEGGEIISPSIAHGYATSAVVGKLVVPLVVATIFCSAPRIVFGRELPLGAVTVCGESSLNTFAFVAAATLDVTASQIAGHHGSLIAAVAQACPIGAAGSSYVPSDYLQSSESLPHKIDEFTAHV